MNAPPRPRERFREAIPLTARQGGRLIYDIERTYVLTLPASLSGRLPDWPPDAADEELCAWLRDKDLLTIAPVTDLRADPDSPLPGITDVSIDLPGACNMGCTYCFEKPIFSRIGRMAEATVDKSLDFAFRAAAGAPRVALHFGSGEPVIEFRQLRALVDKALRRAAETGQTVGFELTTNATLVTPEIARFFADHPFNIRVSCDGPSAIHDRFRPMANGRGSYALVERGLGHLLDALPDRVTVNSVICSGTRLIDLWQWAKGLGVRHYHAIKVGSGKGDDAALAARDLADFIEDNEAIADEIFETLARGERPIDYQPMTKVVRRLLLPQPVTRFCGVAASYVGIAADGAIYPCFRHLGLKEYRLGDVESGVDDGRRRDYRRNEAADVDSRPICSSCWARYICGGGCYADSVVYGPDKLAPQTAHCPFWRAEIAAGIRLYERLRSTDPALCLLMFGNDVEAILDAAEARVLEPPRTA